MSSILSEHVPSFFKVSLYCALSLFPKCTRLPEVMTQCAFRLFHREDHLYPPSSRSAYLQPQNAQDSKHMENNSFFARSRDGDSTHQDPELAPLVSPCCGSKIISTCPSCGSDATGKCRRQSADNVQPIAEESEAKTAAPDVADKENVSEEPADFYE